MPKDGVAIRLGTEGKAQVINDFAEIGTSGDNAAKRFGRTFEEQSAIADAALAKIQRAAAKVSFASPDMAPQRISDQSLVGQRDQARQYQDFKKALADYSVEEEKASQRAEALRRAIDPLYAAQKRYDAELANANDLLARKKITEGEHAAAVANSERVLNRARKELDGHSVSLGLNRMQAITAQSAILRFTDSIIAGQSPLRAFALEAHKGAEVLALDEGGMAGGLAKVRGLLTPVTIGLGLTAAAAIAGVAAWYSYDSALEKMSALAVGSGRLLGLTGDQLMASAEAAASAGHITSSAAEEIEAAYLRIAKSREILEGLTAITQDFASATGQDLKGAEQELAGAFENTIAGAESMAEKYGALNSEQIRHIDQLVEEGKEMEAQRELLAALQPAFDGAAQHATGLALAWSEISRNAQNAWHWMGKALNDYGGYGLYGATGNSAFLLGMAQGGAAGGPNEAAANAARARALAATRGYTGDNRDSIRTTIGTLRAGIAAGGTPDELRQLTESLQANEHALTTWMPAADKARRISELDTQIAGAKTKSQKEALTTERARVEMSGRVITATDAEAEAHNKGAAAAERFKGHTDKHAEALRREAESMEVNTRETLKLAEAYMTIGQSELVAEARRKAMTDATRKGIDVEAQVRRQVALSVAEGVLTQAKALGQVRDETHARAELNDRLADGSLAAADYNQQLHDEDALRPLLKLKLVAHGEALEIVTKLIDDYTDALRESHEEEARNAALTGADAALRHASDTLAIAKLAGDRQAQALEATRLAAEHEADDKHMTGPDRDTFLRSRSAEALANVAGQRAEYVARTVQEQKDGLAITQRELQLVGANDNYRQAELDKLRTILELKREGIDPESAIGRAVLANVAALDEEAAKLRDMSANWDELRSAGDQFIDDVLNPDNWKSFGDFGKMVLRDLEQELTKLALINPLKNWLFGEHNATGGGILGALLKLGGDVASAAAGGGGGGAKITDNLPKFAGGTDYAPGGLALVGEEGPELLNIPRGSRVSPAAATRRLLGSPANDGAMGPVIFNDFTGAVVTEELMREANRQTQRAIDERAPGIAQQGAKMAIEARARRFAR